MQTVNSVIAMLKVCKTLHLTRFNIIGFFDFEQTLDMRW